MGYQEYAETLNTLFLTKRLISHLFFNQHVALGSQYNQRIVIGCLFRCHMVLDLAGRSPFELVSMSFWRVSIFLPYILHYLVLSACSLASWNQPSRVLFVDSGYLEMKSLCCVCSLLGRCYLQALSLHTAGRCTHTRTHAYIYTSVSIYSENHEFSSIPQISVQHHGGHSRFLPSHVFVPSSLTLRNKPASRYLTIAM